MRSSEKKLTAILLALLVSVGLFATGAGETSEGLTILTSTSIIGDVVENIVGDVRSIEVLIPKGGNPHNYEPTPRDMALIEKADLIFVNGFGLEETLLEVLENVATGSIVEVSSTIDPIDFDDDHDEHEGEHHEEHHHDKDPHTWTSPLNVVKWTTVISQALAELDPANAALYQSNGDAYIAKLLALDSVMRESFASVPEEEKILVSDHLTFGYFARDYGFETEGALLPSFSTNSEISAKDLTELIEVIDEHQVKAVFIGSTSGDSLKKMAHVLVEEADHPVQVLSILTGSLSADGDMGDSYLSFIEYNVNQIVKGLGN